MLKKLMECIFCKHSNPIIFIDNYKYELNSDLEYLGDMKIYGCDECGLYFSQPTPNLDKLDYFYKKIYRKEDRPHYFDQYTKKTSYLDDINLNYLLYLTTFIDFNNINTIFDFGAGLGNLGYLIKKNFSHVELYCCENDENCVPTLLERGYKNYQNLESIGKKFDLIISLHCLEHLNNLDPLIKLKELMNPKAYFFFEVPNCPFENKHMQRIFDSPHLLFFTEKSLKNIFRKIQMRWLNFSFSSYSIDHDFKNQLSSKQHSQLTIKKKIVVFLKKFQPNYILNIRRKILKYKLIDKEDKMKWYVNNQRDSRCLRGILTLK